LWYNRGMKICPVCQKPINDPKHPNRRYCSSQCAGKAIEKPELQPRPCANCGKIYKPRRASQKYCSLTCFGKPLVKSLPTMICETCGKPFIPSPNSKGRFCSHECLFHKPSTAVKIICQQCGKSFMVNRARMDKAKYCSQACKSEAGHAWLTCIQCGKTVKVRRHVIEYGRYTGKFCSYKCAATWQKGPNHSNWQGGYEKWRGPNWFAQHKAARERDNHTCQNCGITESELGRPLDVHHIQPWRSFDHNWQEANRLENLTSLCQRCHTSLEPRPHRNRTKQSQECG
jgi:hypothetical protein